MQHLRAATQDILKRIETLSGKSVQFMRDDSLSVLATLQMEGRAAAFQAGFVQRLFEKASNRRFDFAPAQDDEIGPAKRQKRAILDTGIKIMILRNLAVKISLFVSSLLAVGSLSHAQELWREYEGSVPITEDRSGRTVFDIPLPEGKWIVSYLKTRSTTGMSSSTMKDVSVLQVEDGKLRHAFWIVALVDQKNMRWTDEPCKIDPVYYKNNYGTGLWKQKCLTVRYRQFLQNNNSVTIDALKYFSENKISNDFNSVSSVYTRYDDLGKFLIVESFSFPSAYGLNNPVVGVLNTSPYHPSLISQHPEEKAYVDAYIKYSEMMAAAFDSAYEGKKAANLPRMKFPDSEPLDEKTKSGLDLLDKALAAKIIDQEEYQKKKGQLLERAIK